MKVDLHCHTKAIKIGDKGRAIDAESFSQKLQAAGVCIAAITNHNSFDIDQYNEFVKTAGSSIMIWPGVELDVYGHYGEEKSFGHITVIVDPENAEELASIVTRKCKGDPNQFKIDIDEVLPMLSTIPRFFIACHHMKTPALSDADIRYLESNAPDFSVVVREPSSSRKAGMIVNAKSNCWYGSDVKSWDYYDGRDLPELAFEITSFGAFLDLLGKNNNAVTLKTCLNKKGPITAHIELYGDLVLDFNLYSDVNVIFGGKATGKTDILHAIDDYFTASGKNVERFYIERKNDSFLERIDQRPTDTAVSSFSNMFCEEELSVIARWNQRELPSLKRFKEAKENADKIDLMKRLGISRATFSEVLDESLLSSEKETLASEIDTINSTIDIAKRNVLEATETERLISLLDKMKQKLIDNYQQEWLNYQANCLEKFTIDFIKKAIATKEGIPVTPTDTGLKQTFEEYSSINIATRKIKRCLSRERMLAPVLIGNLSSKGQVKLVTHIGIKNQAIDSHPKEWTKRKYIDSSANQQMFLEFSKRINSVQKNLLTNDCAGEIANLKSYMEEHGITSLHKFMNYLNVLTNDYSNDFKPSNGEQSILLVDAALNKRDCDVILLDEPDSGMGADYINDILIPEIRARADENKIIVIVTHDPNMVVRTHPYSCLYRTESDSLSYKSYMGSSFEEFMHNPDDASDKKSWVDSVLSICEGGSEAFNERMITYGEYGYYKH